MVSPDRIDFFLIFGSLINSKCVGLVANEYSILINSSLFEKYDS